MKKRFLVTGANGQLGSEWVRYLEAQGFEFIASDSKTLDITDINSITKHIEDFSPDVLINCAAYTKVDQAEDEPGLATAVNFDGVRNLAEACKKHDVLLVHFSTDYVFSGDMHDFNIYPDGYDENMFTGPIGVYGRSKLMGEGMIHKSECDHLIIRVSWLCSAFGSNFMKTMLKLGNQRSELNVVNDQFGSPTFTFDVVEATLLLLEKKLKGTFHVSCMETMTWYDFACMIFEEAGISIDVSPVPTEAYPTKAKRPSFSKLNTNKFRKLTGHSGFSVREGIKRALVEMEQTDI